MIGIAILGKRERGDLVDYDPPLQTQAFPTEGKRTLTDEWLDPPIKVADEKSWKICANLMRDDLWHEVQVDDKEPYIVPPWKYWKELDWHPPKHIGNCVRARLIPEKNGGIHTAEYSWWLIRR
jgi:hypothetical protein